MQLIIPIPKQFWVDVIMDFIIKKKNSGCVDNLVLPWRVETHAYIELPICVHFNHMIIWVCETLLISPYVPPHFKK